MSLFSKILSTSFTLFLLMDSLGNIPLFLTILKHQPRRRQQIIIFRELLIALGIIILFSGLGDFLLSFLNVRDYTILISGGIILFLIALKMIFPQPEAPSLQKEEDKEPFIVPLAIPLVAGPAVLAAVMLYSKQEHWLISLSSIILAWTLTTVILISASHLQKFLGQRGLTACERLMGLILTLLAVQMFLRGLASYVGAECLSSSM